MQERRSIRRPRAQSRQLANEVCELIAEDFIFSGRVPIGKLLPSETRLASEYSVSRVTIRSALRILQGAELIRVRNGIGSVVMARPPIVSEGIDQLSSLETRARETSAVIDSAELEWGEEAADERAAKLLAVPVGSTLYVAQRVKLVNGARVSWGVERVPADVLPLETLQTEFAGSVMDVLLAHDELAVDYADAELEPVKLPRDVARRLGLPAGSVAQFLEQVMYTVDGTPVQWGQVWLVPEHHRFQVRRRRTIAPPVVRRPGADAPATATG